MHPFLAQKKRKKGFVALGPIVPEEPENGETDLPQPRTGSKIIFFPVFLCDPVSFLGHFSSVFFPTLFFFPLLFSSILANNNSHMDMDRPSHGPTNCKLHSSVPSSSTSSTLASLLSWTRMHLVSPLMQCCSRWTSMAYAHRLSESAISLELIHS